MAGAACLIVLAMAVIGVYTGVRFSSSAVSSVGAFVLGLNAAVGALLLTLPGEAPAWLAPIPILGLVAALRDVLLGEIRSDVAVQAVLSTVALIIVGARAAARAVEREPAVLRA
jgi:hypothetical protein